MSKMDEQIVVVSRAVLFGIKDEFAFQGLFKGESNLTEAEGLPMTDLDMYLTRAVDNVQIKRRGDMEEDPTYKQIIPYVVLYTGDGPDRKIFSYVRLTGGGETRLHNKVSFGVGGHMNELSDALGFVAEARREIDEELTVSTETADQFTYNFLGLINDDSDEVGKVHLGVLIGVEVPASVYQSITVRETDQLEGSWVPVDRLKSIEERLENWTRLSLPAFA